MVKQTAVAGPMQRAEGVRLHSEMGDAGELIWAEVTGSEWIGRKRFPSWRGTPPIDTVDHAHGIGYQVKTITNPDTKVNFSGAHREVVRRKAGGGNVYVGSPEDKLERIRAWLARGNPWGYLHGWLVVMLLDEEANRVAVYSLPDVRSARIDDMVYLGVIDNESGTFHVRADAPREALPPNVEPGRVFTLRHRFPRIPKHLRSSVMAAEEEDEAVGRSPYWFRRPGVRVRQHARRRSRP